MRFKVGDKAMVIPDMSSKKKYNISIGTPMLEMKGKIVTIAKTYYTDRIEDHMRDTYRIKELDGWYFSADMLLPPDKENLERMYFNKQITENKMKKYKSAMEMK